MLSLTVEMWGKGSPLPPCETERISCGVKECIVSLVKKTLWNEGVWVIQPILRERDGPTMTPVKRIRYETGTPTLTRCWASQWYLWG